MLVLGEGRSKADDYPEPRRTWRRRMKMDVRDAFERLSRQTRREVVRDVIHAAIEEIEQVRQQEKSP